jgi:hypothetical protein
VVIRHIFFLFGIIYQEICQPWCGAKKAVEKRPKTAHKPPTARPARRGFGLDFDGEESSYYSLARIAPILLSSTIE